MPKTLLPFFVFLLAACSGPGADPNEANLLASNNFESVDGWTSGMPVPSLTKEKAHSGRYSVIVDPKVEFSLGYTNFLRALSASALKKVKVQAWILVPNRNAAANIVLQIVDSADLQRKPYFWQALDVMQQVKKDNQWVEVAQEFTLPANTAPTHMLSTYLWRRGDQRVYMDDLRILKVE
ncbi:carbohydrate binding domain-containing protein [Hymenobacter sp. BT664]|uniref:Carbohydrate binding domain-containing protein n=1 Tax=Hymenobacter montanus TaxID=2771359 RepID=A0A927BB18_9BACT|nr:carbohydrate binding domain-containing protein [Hymenobacter montanus]MBD2766894.1 carbohydrate binding domain-containing protein [Hymenobacter montanus]